MIGQFVSRFVGGLKTYQLLAALLAFPSIPLALWFSVLYYYHLNSIGTAERFGTVSYVLANAIGLFVLTLLFQSQWLQIQWVGTVVIGMYLAALAYMFFVKRGNLKDLDGQAAPLNTSL